MLLISKSKQKLLAITAILVILLTGCAVPVAPVANTTTGEQAATGEKIKVVFWAHEHAPRVPLDEKYIAEFMAANPNIEVEYEVIPSDFDTKLRTALAAGTGPDLFAQ